MAAITEFQENIVAECLRKRRGCICVPMGSGKTLMSLTIISRTARSRCKRSLVVCSKTLLVSWIEELTKHFPSIKYVVYHKDFINRLDRYVPDEGVELVITTPETVLKAYKENRVQSKFLFIDIVRLGGMDIEVNRYVVPTKPLLPDNANGQGAFLYKMQWNCIVIDEIQQYTNITTGSCRAISSVYAKYRWGLSGTPIAEPKTARVLGYHMLIGDEKFPNTLPKTSKHINESSFTGMRPTMVVRTASQLDYTLPTYTEHLVEHELTDAEKSIYMSLQTVVETLYIMVRSGDMSTEEQVRLRASMLAMLVYIRQCIVVPLVPYANLTTSYIDNSVVSDLFKEEIDKINIGGWLADENASKSTRICSVINVLNRHSDEKCIIFSCFRTSIDVMKYYIAEIREVFVVQPNHSITRRSRIFAKFSDSTNGVLIMTYSIGAEGLNLQHTHVVMLTDVWWNDAKSQQSIARVLRRGQTEHVHVYSFTSNTAIEKGLFRKHMDKRNLIESLMDGPISGSVRSLSMDEIYRLVTDGSTTESMFEARARSHGTASRLELVRF